VWHQLLLVIYGDYTVILNLLVYTFGQGLRQFAQHPSVNFRGAILLQKTGHRFNQGDLPQGRGAGAIAIAAIVPQNLLRLVHWKSS